MNRYILISVYLDPTGVVGLALGMAGADKYLDQTLRGWGALLRALYS